MNYTCGYHNEQSWPLRLQFELQIEKQAFPHHAPDLLIGLLKSMDWVD